MMPPDPSGDTTVWQGELLWPCSLPEGEVIDLSQVEAIGAWAYAWFRERPQQAVVGASPALKRQLQMARLPILWYASRRLPALREGAGRSAVTSGERDLLWGSDG